MIALHRTLVPLDFSDPSIAAVNYGVALDRNFEAR
jgi:hypothetical protein